MDPDAALRTMLDRDAPFGDRRDAAVALVRWLDGDGFLPELTRPQLRALVVRYRDDLTLSALNRR